MVNEDCQYSGIGKQGGDKLNKYLIISWLTFLSVFLLILALDLLKGSRSKFGKYINKANSIYDVAENLSPFVSNFTDEVRKEEMKNKLNWAGNPFGLTVEGYYSFKIILGLLGFALGMFLYPFGMSVFFAVFVAVVFFFIPTLILRSSIEKRQGEIAAELPNMVNLLATAVWAGIELGPAIEHISYNITGALGEVMREAWKEIATGKSREEVLKTSAKNTGVTMFERFVDTIVVAEERGGQELSKVLMDFSYDMKHMQRQILEEKAKKIPTKMLLPLVLCIFIPMLALLLAPIMISVIRTF